MRCLLLCQYGQCLKVYAGFGEKRTGTCAPGTCSVQNQCMKMLYINRNLCKNHRTRLPGAGEIRLMGKK